MTSAPYDQEIIVLSFIVYFGDCFRKFIENHYHIKLKMKAGDSGSSRRAITGLSLIFLMQHYI